MVDTDNHSFQGIWNIVVKFQNLELSDTESTITAALALMNAGKRSNQVGIKVISKQCQRIVSVIIP